MRLWRASHPTLVVELEALAVMGVINSAPTLPTIDKVYTFCFVFLGGGDNWRFPGWAGWHWAGSLSGPAPSEAEVAAAIAPGGLDRSLDVGI